MFPLAVALLAAVLPLQGQTNALPALSPPYGELPPTFWDQHGTFVMLAGLGVVSLMAFGVWLTFRPKPKTIVPPEVQARQALEVLRQHPENGVCLSRISQVLQNYFITAFQLAPGEFTTTEFSRMLADCGQMDAGLTSTVVEFLRECDGRKFPPVMSMASCNSAAKALELIESAEKCRMATKQKTG